MFFQVVIILILTGGFAVLTWLLLKQKNGVDQRQMENVVAQVFGLSAQKIAEQSRQILAGEKEIIRVDLENKQRSIENLVLSLQKEIGERQLEIRSLEQDRNKKFSEIVTSLETHRRSTEDLRISTQQLASVLSNNQTRGAWGERIIEDLLQANGLIEGIHYLKQAKLETTTLRPDITLLLPNKRNVPVDVKFPYSEIQKMAATENKSEKEAHLKQFAVDLKIKINKVAEYINPAYQTLDYAILFVPNEMVFSFINQRFSELVDEAMSKRVIIVSPFTFLVVARTVIESYRNFMMEDKLRDIIQYVAEFTQEWGAFQEEFGKLGRSLESVTSGYEKLASTRTKQMNKKIKKIQEHETGKLLESETEIVAEKI
jgi:DNA recombination protein RmuC